MKRIVLASLLSASFIFAETVKQNTDFKDCDKYLEKADQALNMSMEINYLSSVAKIQIKAGYALEATAQMQRYEICKRNLTEK